jgi:hypothetical protein
LCLLLLLKISVCKINIENAMKYACSAKSQQNGWLRYIEALPGDKYIPGLHSW